MDPSDCRWDKCQLPSSISGSKECVQMTMACTLNYLMDYTTNLQIVHNKIELQACDCCGV